MCSGPAKPVILISYSHKDEPDRAPEGEVYWLTYVQSYLALAVREANGTFELWTDKDIVVGTNWRAGIEAKLAACSICILLVSRHSLDSEFVLKVEIEAIRKRQRQGRRVEICPILLSKVPDKGVPAWLRDLQLRPSPNKPLSGLRRQERETAMANIVDEIISFSARTPRRQHHHRQSRQSSRPMSTSRDCRKRRM